MRWSILVLLAILLFSFGCIEEKGFPGTQSEQLAGSQGFDLDKDGGYDYQVFMFNPVSMEGSGMVVERQVTVSTRRTGTYTSVSPNLTDVDLLVADQSLEEFSQTRTQSDTACSNRIGLASVVCSDVTTCSRLCSASSQKCRIMAEDYQDELAGAMISYVGSNNELRSLILDSRRMVFGLRQGTDQERDQYLSKILSMIAEVAEINANPLYTHPELTLCTASDFGVSYLVDAAGKIGTYETQTSGYHYRVMLHIKPEEKEHEGIGKEISGVTVTDRMPAAALGSGEEIKSIQKVVVGEQSGWTTVTWSSAKASEKGYLLVYEFDSATPPENLFSGLKSPDLEVRTFDLSGLILTNMIFVMLGASLDNYYLALGIAIGITISLLFLLYTVLVLVFTIINEKLSGHSITTGFRKAFGRTEVRWKSDILLAIGFLMAGLYLSIVQASPPVEPPALMESVDFLIESGWGAVGVTCMLIGAVMAYFSVENYAKIILLEKIYGRVMKGERDTFLNKVEELKKRMEELKGLVESYGAENFDVSQEYDTLTAIRASKVDSLAKEVTVRNKTLVDEYLSRVERSINSLEEKKRLTDENWPKWKEAIAKMMEEQDEVYASSLVTVPASLRQWALSRYAKDEGILLERDAIKKVKVTPEKIIKEMIGKGLLSGVIVIQNERVQLTEFADGSGTVVAALALKLRAYLRSLAKNLGQHSPQSFVSIGKKTVIVLMKSRNMESLLFINRAKFNDAIEQWKSKMKAFEG